MCSMSSSFCCAGHAGQNSGENSGDFHMKALLGETETAEAARSDEMAEDTVSLNALMQVEL